MFSDAGYAFEPSLAVWLTVTCQWIIITHQTNIEDEIIWFPPRSLQFFCYHFPQPLHAGPVPFHSPLSPASSTTVCHLWYVSYHEGLPVWGLSMESLTWLHWLAIASSKPATWASSASPVWPTAFWSARCGVTWPGCTHTKQSHWKESQLSHWKDPDIWIKMPPVLNVHTQGYFRLY